MSGSKRRMSGDHNFSQTKMSDRAMDRARVRKRAFTYESASSSSCSSSSSKRQCSRQLTKSTFQKWQRSYEKEHQTLTWLKCELDHDKVSVVSLSCTVCKKYESKICSLKNSTNAWITGSTNLKSTNVLDHANSAVHKAAMGHMRVDVIKASGQSPMMCSPIGQYLTTLDSRTQARMKKKFDVCY